MKKNLSPKYQVWIDARKKYHLSHAQIQMARELGMNPKKFGKLANNNQEPWKVPLPQFIEEIYLKHFKKDKPEIIRSIEQIAADKKYKNEERKKRKAIEKNNKTIQQSASSDVVSAAADEPQC